MSSTDDRIVRMQFDNAQFKKGAVDTQKSLADLNKSVDSAGKGKGLLDLSASMGRVSASASAMAVVTTTAIATIANKATNAALNLAKGLTFDPIRGGFAEYESSLTKLNTIMNATGKSQERVKAVLLDLNKYSDETIYSYADMTSAIQKFVNAGVGLDQSVESVKGIANAAAFAGASSEEASRAMYAFSQSMSLGFVGLQDWNQIENANMGTIQFKNELLKAAVAAGTLTKKGNEFVTASGKTISATKGWRDGLQEQWATTEVLNSALGKYSDQSTKLGRKASEAATEVRTFTAFMDTLKESIESGWAGIFTALVGDLDDATHMWTGLSEAIGGVIGPTFEWAQLSLNVWRDMGGATKVMQGFQNILAPIGAILGVIGNAWRTAFPSSGSGSGKQLYALSAAFEAVTRPLQWLADVISGATPVVTTFFRVLRIGFAFLKSGANAVGDFIGKLLALVDIKAPSSGGMVGFVKDLASAIGKAVEKIDSLLSKGASLTEAFSAVDIKLPSMPSLPSLPSLPKMGSIFGGGGDKQDTSKIVRLSSGVKDLTKNVKGLNEAQATSTFTMDNMGEVASNTGSKLTGLAKGAKDVVSSVGESGSDVESAGSKIGDTFSKIKGWLADFIGGIQISDIVQSFNLALLATFVVAITKFLFGMSNAFKAFSGTGEAINGVLESAADGLKSFQTNARAKLILNLGIAIGILAASLWVLSTIPKEDLAKALLALGTAMFFMNKSMGGLTRLLAEINGNGLQGSVNMFALTVAVVGLAAAMLLLSTALLIMNKVEWGSILKGLLVMGALMKVMEILGRQAEDSWKQMAAGAAALIAVAVAMNLLALALIAFKLVDEESMVKAGIALLAVVVAIGVLGKLMSGPHGAAAMAAAGASFLLASTGMMALANALILFQFVEWESLKKAGAALAGLALALLVMTAAAPAGAVLPLVGLGLIAIATALIFMNKVDWSTIPKLAVAMLALSVGLMVLAPALYIAGPALIMFGVAMLAIGAGVLMFVTAMSLAAGIAVVAAGAITAMAVALALGIATFLQTLALQAPVMKASLLTILQEMIDTIVEAVPMIIDGFQRLWKAVMDEFGGSKGNAKGAQMKTSSKSWMEKLADGIKEKIPAITKKAVEIIIAFLQGLKSRAKEFAQAAVELIAKFIEGIGSRIDRIVKSAVELIAKFIEAVGKQSKKIAKAAAQAVIDFIEGMAVAIEEKSGPLAEAMKDLGIAMVKGLINGIKEWAGDAIKEIGNLGGSLISKAKSVIKSKSPSRVFMDIGRFIVQGLTIGIQNNAAAAINATAAMMTGQIATANEYMSRYIQQLDQQSIAARGKAEGLALAAKRAADAANKTKDNRADDRSANKLGRKADRAAKIAEAAERKAESAKAAQDRKEQFDNASYLGKAQMRSEDAQNQLAAAKAAETRAAKNRQAAEALEKQARAKGVSGKDAKKFRKEADDLRAQARRDAAAANASVAAARKSAGDALAWQKKAGDEAAAAFQNRFEAEAKADADAAAFDKLSNAEKAAQRRKEAEELRLKSEKDLTEAKKLAYSDLDAANALANIAIEEAEQARKYLDEALKYEQAGGGGPVVNLEATEAAALAFDSYTDLYNRASAAAAATAPKVEFNQYNTSPEALSPSEIYRRTNNQLTFATDQLADAAA